MKIKALLCVVLVNVACEATCAKILPTFASIRQTALRVLQSKKICSFMNLITRHRYLTVTATITGTCIAIPQTRRLIISTLSNIRNSIARTLRRIIRGFNNTPIEQHRDQPAPSPATPTTAEPTNPGHDIDSIEGESDEEIETTHREKMKLDEYPSNALHMAIEGNNVEMVRWLATSKEQLNDVKDVGRPWNRAKHFTVLHSAVLRGNREVVQILLAAGARQDTVDVLAPRVLHVAARRGYRDIIHDLLEKNKEDIDLTNGDGLTPLHLAAERGHTGAVEELLAAGADINVRNHLSDSPLHRAASRGHTAVIRLLINAGADINALGRGREGETPLHFAALNGHQETIQVLVQLGADTNKLDGRKRKFDQVAISKS